MNHKYLKHHDCHVTNCIICDGGILYCEVCQGAEGTLTTDCCGRKLTDVEESLIANGIKDYANKKWVNK